MNKINLNKKNAVVGMGAIPTLSLLFNFMMLYIISFSIYN